MNVTLASEIKPAKLGVILTNSQTNKSYKFMESKTITWSNSHTEGNVNVGDLLLRINPDSTYNNSINIFTVKDTKENQIDNITYNTKEINTHKPFSNLLTDIYQFFENSTKSISFYINFPVGKKTIVITLTIPLLPIMTKISASNGTTYTTIPIKSLDIHPNQSPYQVNFYFNPNINITSCKFTPNNILIIDKKSINANDVQFSLQIKPTTKNMYLEFDTTDENSNIISSKLQVNYINIIDQQIRLLNFYNVNGKFNKEHTIFKASNIARDENKIRIAPNTKITTGDKDNVIINYNSISKSITSINVSNNKTTPILSKAVKNETKNISISNHNTPVLQNIDFYYAPYECNLYNTGNSSNYISLTSNPNYSYDNTKAVLKLKHDLVKLNFNKVSIDFPNSNEYTISNIEYNNKPVNNKYFTLSSSLNSTLYLTFTLTGNTTESPLLFTINVSIPLLYIQPSKNTKSFISNFSPMAWVQKHLQMNPVVFKKKIQLSNLSQDNTTIQIPIYTCDIKYPVPIRVTGGLVNDTINTEGNFTLYDCAISTKKYENIATNISYHNESVFIPYNTYISDYASNTFNKLTSLDSTYAAKQNGVLVCMSNNNSQPPWGKGTKVTPPNALPFFFPYCIYNKSI